MSVLDVVVVALLVLALVVLSVVHLTAAGPGAAFWLVLVTLALLWVGNAIARGAR